MLSDDEYWMREALAQANLAFSKGEVPVGAVIVQDNRIVGKGFNQPISSNDPSAHAEVVAIRDACKNLHNYRLVDATLFVTIEPCTMCFGSIVHARIQRVVYGANEPKAGVLCSHKHLIESDIYNHRFEVLEGVLAKECSSVIQDFFKLRREEKKCKENKSEE
ncbi:MAG: tRNA adenosine(34) deaminase TadA [Agarilytica sp.]